MSILPESRLWFEGGSTVRGFTCEATALDGSVVTRDGAEPRVAALKSAVESVSIIVASPAAPCRYTRRVRRASHQVSGGRPRPIRAPPQSP